MNVILYSTGCSKCDVLKDKLTAKNISFTVVTDISVMDSLGIQFVPVLQIENNLMNYKEAVEWVNKQEVSE